MVGVWVGEYGMSEVVGWLCVVEVALRASGARRLGGGDGGESVRCRMRGSAGKRSDVGCGCGCRWVRWCGWWRWWAVATARWW